MSSLRQIEANRRNARLSTGPISEKGKQRSRRNAVRHGLMAETVVGSLEDSADYTAFELAITADYEPESAVERELVLRLASLLWRLRRATTIESGLFHLQTRHNLPGASTSIAHGKNQNIVEPLSSAGSNERGAEPAEKMLDSGLLRLLAYDDGAALSEGLTRSYIYLSEQATCPLDRLSRYESRLWRQACQIISTLQSVQRRGTWWGRLSPK